MIRAPKNGKTPIYIYTYIIDGIHNIKGKTYVNVLISNYTNKHITFNKGEYEGLLEPPIEEKQQTPANADSLTNHSISMERVMAKKVEPDIFKPSCHRLKEDIETKLEEMLREYQFQFIQDETNIGTTSLTKMTRDTRTLEPVSQMPYPIAMK